MAPSKQGNQDSASKLKQGSLFSFFAKKTTSSTSSDKKIVNQKKDLSSASKVEKTETEDLRAINESLNNSTKKNITPSQTINLPEIGSRIEAYWPDDNEWYAATVTKQKGKKHYLEYDDGQTEWIDLSTERFRLVGSNTNDKPQNKDTEQKKDESEQNDPNTNAKRRRIQVEEEDEEEMEFQFDDDVSEDDGSAYVNDEGSKHDQSDDELIVTDDDYDETTSPKNRKNNKRKNPSETKVSRSSPRKKNVPNGGRISLSQFKAGRVKVTEHPTDTDDSNLNTATNTPPNQITPSAPASSGKKTPLPSGSPPIVQISSSMQLTSSPRATPNGTTKPIQAQRTQQSSHSPSSSPPMFIMNELNPAGSHVHNHLNFLRNPKDLMGRTPDHPNYDPRTLQVNEKDWIKLTGKPMTNAVRQWWDLKSQYFDTVLLFKTGKFYELFHMDADIGVKVCGFIYMKGHCAHSGFPEISYGLFADKLVRAGYKVARVEQTETPQQLQERKKQFKGKDAPKVVNREVCSIMTIGTRTFCYLDQSEGKESKGDSMEFDRAASPDEAGCLLAIREIIVHSEPNPRATSDDNDEEDDVRPVCEYGITVVDTVRGTVTIGQFADDVLRSRMLTLLTTFTPSEILIQGGEDGASETLRSLLTSLQTTAQLNFRVEVIKAVESFPKSTAIEAGIRRQMERGSGSHVNYVNPWDVQETISELHRRKYYPRSSKQSDDERITRWPKVLQAAIEGGADLAISSFGACLYYLQRNIIDHELLSMGIVKAYIPPESYTAVENAKSREIVQLAQLKDNEEAGLDDGLSVSYSKSSGSHLIPSEALEQSFREDEITFMSLDGTTLHNLEILTNAVDHKVAGSLWSKINYTKSPHGSRLLRAWLLRPLFRKADIDRRLDAVTELASGGAAVALQEARTILAKCGDIERLLSRVHSMGVGAAGDDDADRFHPNERAVLFEEATYTKRKVGDFSKVLNGLRRATQIPEVFEGIDIQSGLLKKVVRLVDRGGCFPDMVQDLDWFFSNFDCELASKGLFEPSKGIDELFDSASENIERIKGELMAYRDEMCSNFLHPRGQAKSAWKYINTTPDSKDKYMIELPAHIRVPDDFLMKGKRGSGQKQVNKYRTQAIEELVQELEASYEVLKERKSKGMQLIFAKFDSKRDLWAAAAQATALLDALGSLAHSASKAGYTRPIILDCPPNASPSIQISQGRHPCVENAMGTDFIPNDLQLGLNSDGSSSPRVLLLSGPNMGGKSTLLRQTCLIAILSQLGSYVPATECKITPIDRIFTRLGASDRILLGQSTFFVELAETAAALRGATRRSLVIMDELGRGTSTFDGTAIASATVQHLVERSQCLSLFATHYHTLLDQWKEDQRVRLGHMECLVEGSHSSSPTSDNSEIDDTNITFLYTLGEGVCPKSFGINVARLAGLPNEVLVKAKRISTEFENEINSLDTNRATISYQNALELKQKLLDSIDQQDWEAVQSIWKQLQ